MRKRNMIATGALVVASLLMVAPAAQAGGSGGGVHHPGQLLRTDRLEAEGQTR